MAGPLALVGGDELHPGNEPQDALLAEAAADGPAYVIATAAARHRPELAVAHAHEWFARFGLDVVELPVRTKTQARSAETAALASGRDVLLPGGRRSGHRSRRAGAARPSGEPSSRRGDGGAALAGSSAGAMALGRWTLIRGARPGGPRTSVPRRARAGAERRRAAALRHVRPGVGGVCLGGRPSDDVILLGIDERAAAVWSDGRWRAMGDGGVTVITSEGERAFVSGEAIDGLPAPAVP